MLTSAPTACCCMMSAKDLSTSSSPNLTIISPLLKPHSYAGDAGSTLNINAPATTSV